MTGYWSFVALARTAFLYVALVAAVISLGDWLARTRRVNPFGAAARFFRTSVDPFLMPLERVVVRTGGRPSTTPWWGLVAFVMIALVLIALLDFAGGVIGQLAYAIESPRAIPLLALSWGIALLRLALIVRVVSSWTAVSPTSKWIRWSFALTEWMLAPLRRFIPLVGMIDVTPLVAWLLLSLLQRVVGIP